jgi:hypothetical protein
MGGARRTPHAPLAPRPGTAVPLRDCRYDRDQFGYTIVRSMIRRSSGR